MSVGVTLTADAGRPWLSLGGMVARKVGGLIAGARQRAKVTQVDAGVVYGCTDKAWSRWETGERLPSIRTLLKIAETLNCNLVIELRPRR